MGKIRHKLRGLFAMATFGFVAAVFSFSYMGSAVAAEVVSGSREALFNGAAQEFGVPVSVLMAVSYNQSRWQSHGTQASVDGGFGLMNLTTPVAAFDGRGDPKRPMPPTTTTKTHYTLDEAAGLLQVSRDTLKSDDQQNIRGAAAVLAKYARQNNNGQLPTSVNDWYSAVAAFSGNKSADTAAGFADDVYATIQNGAQLSTTDGQKLSLSAESVQPKRADLGNLKLQAPAAANAARDSNIECPVTISCRFIPAAYAPNSADPFDYGNYDPANRPKDMKINTIVIHDTEGSYQSAIDHFQDTKAFVSCNYIIRSSDGAVTQMVRNKDTQWCAGDWYVNMHSINIEHEGFAAQGAAWYTEAMYQSSAKLVRYLANKYNVPLDRQHIIGHDNIPGLSARTHTNQHWDPGPYWDWNHYMDLLHAPDDTTGPVTADTKVLTITPNFATNQPPVTDCATGTCVILPAQGTSFVYLHTQPSVQAPLLSDQYLHPDGAQGTTQDNDWGDKAATGQKFAVAGQQGDWTGIYYSGQVGWFFNPSGLAKTAKATNGKTITPKAGLSSIPVYGGAYPESSAYPAEIPFQQLNPLYTIPAGQKYVTRGLVPTDYYYAVTVNYSQPLDHTVVRGNERYYQINFNHRIAYVKANDVEVRNN